MSTADRFAAVAQRLRARGFVVHEVPGWQTRGKGTLRPAGFINHHTAGGQDGGNTASLRLVTYGREGLRNALCNWYTARNGDLYNVCAGVAWHAGAGVKGSNSTLIGCEAENDGRGEPWQPRSLDAQAALNQECAREFGFPTSQCWEHKEHAPTRKPDRAGIDGNAWRHRLATHRPSPAPPPILEEDEPVLPINVAPGQEQVVWIEPTNGSGLVPYKKAAIVLTTHLEAHSAKVAAPAVGLGWDPIVLNNRHPFVYFVEGRGGARLVVRNLDGEWHLGGHVIYSR